MSAAKTNYRNNRASIYTQPDRTPKSYARKSAQFTLGIQYKNLSPATKKEAQSWLGKKKKRSK